MLRKKLCLYSESSNEVAEQPEHTLSSESINPTSSQTSSYFHKKATSKTTASKSNELLAISDDLNESLSRIEFLSPVAHIYNPTIYARDLYAQYVQRYGNAAKEVLFLGMNPGPFGMCQTGIPFGNITTVTEWLQLSGTIDQPDNPCPSRPILGLACHREEVSGKRFWELFRDVCQIPATFFRYAYVYNYCPVALINAKGRNLTPGEIKGQKEQILQLEKVCNEALVHVVRVLEVKVVVAIGVYAEDKAKRVLLGKNGVNVTKVLRLAHPSPRSTQSANWAATATAFLSDNNLTHYFAQFP